MEEETISLFIKKERDMRAKLIIEEDKLVNLYYNLIKKDDSYLIKQHIKVILYLTFIDFYDLYKSNIKCFIQKIKLTKKYFQYNFYYLYNEVNQNFPPTYISSTLLDSFFNKDPYPIYSNINFVKTKNSSKKSEDSFAVSQYNVEKLKKFKISTLIYEKIKRFSIKKQNEAKNISIITDNSFKNTLNSVVNDNNIILNDIKKQTKFNILGEEVKNDFLGMRHLSKSTEQSVEEDPFSLACGKKCESKCIKLTFSPERSVGKNVFFGNEVEAKLKTKGKFIKNEPSKFNIFGGLRNSSVQSVEETPFTVACKCKCIFGEKNNFLEMQCKNIEINYETEEERIQNEINLLNKHIQLSKNTLVNISYLKSNFERINNTSKKLLEDKKNEIKYILEKNYCKRTILLDIDILKRYLNDDTISYIKDFVGNIFIKDTRRILIQRRYILNEKQTIQNMLYLWTVKQLLKFEENYLYLKYNMESYSGMGIYDYELNDFLLMYNDLTIGDMFINDSVNDTFQTKMKVINRILSIVRISNFFYFQRNVWILTNKILHISPEDKRRYKCLEFFEV